MAILGQAHKNYSKSTIRMKNNLFLIENNMLTYIIINGFRFSFSVECHKPFMFSAFWTSHVTTPEHFSVQWLKRVSFICPQVEAGRRLLRVTVMKPVGQVKSRSDVGHSLQHLAVPQRHEASLCSPPFSPHTVLSVGRGSTHMYLYTNTRETWTFGSLAFFVGGVNVEALPLFPVLPEKGREH